MVGLFADERHFRNEGSFSQLRVVFAAHFAVVKLGAGAAKWHSCAKVGFVGDFVAAK